MKRFSERLKELRKENGLSAQALGTAIGMSDTTILNWENNTYDII
ncbi:MAG: helix-turn-helix domain-containing protein, partial [Clostridiales bacterium]|nr:helix-turn-helix domain-containing protein [Clostridiales bacterium]